MHIIIAVLVSLVITATIASAQQSLKIGSPAPAFSGSTLAGTPINLKSFEGKVVVMTFWSTRCLICHNEIPKLNTMTTRFDPSKVAFLAFSMEPEEKIAPYLNKNPFRFQIVPNSFATVLQYADRDRKGDLDMGFPAFFVIDKNGTIQHRASGYDKTAIMESVIAKLSSK